MLHGFDELAHIGAARGERSGPYPDADFHDGDREGVMPVTVPTLAVRTRTGSVPPSGLSSHCTRQEAP